jgi:hypothetical protein
VEPPEKPPFDVWRWITAFAVILLGVGTLLLVVAALRVV